MTISRSRLILLACASGVLYPLCFPAFDLGFLAWIALVPLHFSIDYSSSPREAFKLGWLAGTIAFTGAMFWVITAMNLYGKVPILVALLIMLLLTVYLGLYLAIYAGGLAWIRLAFPTLGMLPAPFLWVTLELIRTYFLSGLPWVLFGYSQYEWLPIIQLVDHFGVYGVSFLLVLVNAALAELIVWSVKAYRGFALRSFPWPSAGAAAAGIGCRISLWHDRPGYLSPAACPNTLDRIGAAERRSSAKMGHGVSPRHRPALQPVDRGHGQGAGSDYLARGCDSVHLRAGTPVPIAAERHVP